jgi:aminoglycoside phosphotransferase (APT) family kinase protein
MAEILTYVRDYRVMATNRRFDIVELSEPELTAMIQPVFAGQRVESAELLTGGVINTNYKVTVSAKPTPYVVRVYARDADAVEREAKITDLIADTVPVARTLYRGTRAHTSDAAQGAGSYAIVEWRQGVVLQTVLDAGDTAGIEDAFEHAGSVLAAISKYKFATTGFFNKELHVAHAFGDDPSAYMKQCLSKPEVRERLGDELFEATRRFVELKGLQLSAAGGMPCLVHGDYNPRNLLVSQKNCSGGKNWCVSAVLDWEFAHAGTVLFDIGNMLRTQHKYPQLQSRFISGFTEAGGELHPDWQQLSRFIDLNNLLEFLTGDDRSWVYDEVRAGISRTITRE